jgi:argininosuccinate lyase
MPHKKNPDVFELIRARCNHLQTLPQQILSVVNSLPSGYHRDMQLTKELLLPSLDHIRDCFNLITATIPQVQVNEAAIEDNKYALIYSVENVNQKVLEGTSFRDAYLEVAQAIEDGTFVPSKKLTHTHLGSLGNPGNQEIRKKLQGVLAGFDFDHYQQKLQQLIES